MTKRIQTHSRRLIGFVFLAIIAFVAATTAPLALAQSRSGFDYNGVVHVSWWFNEYSNFDQPTGAATDSRAAIAAARSNWAALLVTQYQANATANSISPLTDRTPTDASLRVAIQDLHARGIKVMLKPHVDSSNGEWRGDFNPSNPTAWFQSYTQFIVRYAQFAQQQGVEGFVMGTEFKTISGAANRARWIAVINAIRSVYGGVLTYAANATFPGDEFTQVSFWDQLDVMGLDAYFTLTNQNNPNLAQLTSAWTSNANGENLVATVQNFASSRGKPVIFTELGYKSVDGANTRPWDFGLSGAQDLSEQRDCYEAAFAVWSQRTSFMKGIFWWDWPAPAPGAGDTDYNPRNKPAGAVLTSWQGPAGTGGTFTLASNPASVSVTRGATVGSTINITRTNFTGSVALSASGLPAGVTAAFNPAATTTNSSTLTFTASSTATTGPATVTVTGTSGTLTRTTTISLTVNAVQAPNFTLAAAPASVSVTQGGTAGSTINITRTNFTGSVALSASGLPAGVTAAFNQASTTGNSSSITFTASSTAATGSATVTVTGTSGTLSRTTTIALTVNAVQAQNFTLAAAPASVSVAQGGTGTSVINITRTNFTGSVALSAGGLPAGVTAVFSPATTTGNSSMLTFTASSTATAGAATVTVTGTSGTLSRTTTVSLTVTTTTGGTGGVTVTPVVNANSPWFNEEFVRLSNTANLTAVTVTILIQRTTGVSFSGIYNTTGQFAQTNTSTTGTITYQFTLNSGPLSPGTNRTFAAQTSGTGTMHPTAGDTYTVTYTSGGVSFTQTGHF